jgi:hypothetical protein
LESGRAENELKHYLHNSSHLYRWFFSTAKLLKQKVRSLPPKALASLERKLEKLVEQLPNIHSDSRELDCACSELALGWEMAAWSARRARLVCVGASTKSLTDELRGLIARFEEIWLRRARPGGLHEATERMRAVEQEL